MEQKYRIHAFYILSFLLLLIILLVTVRWSDIPNLANYISFALTMTSLVLAVVAILYTIYSNLALAQNVASLSNSTSTIATTASAITRTADALATQLTGLPPLIDSVGAKVDKTYALVEASSKQGSESGRKPTAERPQPSATSFLAGASPFGLLVVYVGALAFRTKIGFSLKALSIQAKIGDPSYAHGFLVAASAAGYIDFTSANDVFNVTQYDGEMLRNIDEFVGKYASNTANPQLAKYIEERRKNIKKFFRLEGA